MSGVCFTEQDIADARSLLSNFKSFIYQKEIYVVDGQELRFSELTPENQALVKEKVNSTILRLTKAFESNKCAQPSVPRKCFSKGDLKSLGDLVWDLADDLSLEDFREMFIKAKANACNPPPDFEEWKALFREDAVPWI